MEGFDLAASQKEVRRVKEKCVSRLPELFERFKAEAEAVGVVVHQATDSAAASDIVKRLAKERGVKSIVKMKSMLTEEIELNRRLQDDGLEVVETDLGEYIIQLAGEPPSHFTQPAMHKTREEVAELFSKVAGYNLQPDVAELVQFARDQLRRKFVEADMGISGANALIAETGTLVIVANEGNDRLVTTLPPIHVAVVGYEKLVETMDDAVSILKVLSKSGTGQKQTAYVSFITGPSRTTDIEKTLALGVHGPKEVHVVFVDNGRLKMAEDEELREALYCVKCGACLNLCPVFHSIGGHAFSNAYMGGIGAVLTSYYRGLDECEDTVNICTGCSQCAAICPSLIDTPKMVLALRKRLLTAHGLSLTSRAALSGLRHPGLFHLMLRMARSVQGLFTDDGRVTALPLPGVEMGDRVFPALADLFLRDRVPEVSNPEGSRKVALYAGCVIDFVEPEIGEAIRDVLVDHGCSVFFPKGQSCCGAPALYAGDRKTARQLAEANLLVLEKTGADHIVTGCPTCAVMLKTNLPELLAPGPLKERALALADRIVDFSEFASETLGITLEETGVGKLTYHDPCHQVRGLGTSGCARAIIQGAAGGFVEMKDSDECCGFAGSYSVKQAEISNSILSRKIANIEATGASCVVTDCPGCIMQIRGGLDARGIPVQVRHTAQIIKESGE